MRLNLGEVAYGLGCGPGMVVWDGPGGVPAKPKAAVPSLRDVVRSRAAHDREDGERNSSLNWEAEPWADFVATGAKIDSRQVEPGDLFFCLPGEKADGHDFALAAALAGAAAVIALRNPFMNEAAEEAADRGMVFPPVFLVDDVIGALARLAICHRETCPARVIGITGTAGKTTVKELLAHLLESRGRTERNAKNYNNQIGLPLSMLNASADAAYWVMEVGISQPEDMDELGNILRPDIALILNVGQGHVLGLGDKGVAAHKARLLDYVRSGGLAVVSADYPELEAELAARQSFLGRRGVDLLRFSANGGDVDCRAAYEGPAHDGGGQYRVFAAGDEFSLTAPFRGEFGAENVAAVVAVALGLDLGPEHGSFNLAGARLPEQRFKCERRGGFILIDDSYNANPLSAGRMVRAAADMAGESGLPLMLVMGEMLELGDVAVAAHRELGRIMAGTGTKMVFWKGGNAEAVQAGLKDGGFDGLFEPVDSDRSFRSLLEARRPPAALVLFKGSRGNRMELLLEACKDWLDGGEAKDVL